MDAVHVAAGAFWPLGVRQTSVSLREEAAGAIGKRPFVMTGRRLGIHRQRRPLVESVFGRFVRTHQVERRENHVGLGGQDAVGIIVEPQPAVLRVLFAMPSEVPDAQIPLGGQTVRTEPAPAWPVPIRRAASGWAGRLPPRIAVTAPSHVCSLCARMRWRIVLKCLALSSLMNSAALAADEAKEKGGSERRKHILGIEMPYVGIALAIGVGIAGVQSLHHVVGQVPDPPLPAHLGDNQFDDRSCRRRGCLWGQ